MEQGLLAHIGLTLGSRRVEDLCSTTLVYFMRRYPSARTAFLEMVAASSSGPVPDLSLSTQVALGDSGRPDILGIDGDGRRRLIVEAKLNAGFGPGQMADYALALDETSPGHLVILAPERRLPSLWSDALQQLVSQGTVPEEMSRHVVGFGPHRLLALSWAAALDAIAPHVPESEHLELTNLLDYFGQDTFIPLTSGDLAVTIPRTLRNTGRVLAGVRKRLSQQVSPIVKVGNMSGGNWGFGSILECGDSRVWFGVWFRRWADTAETPFWIQIKNVTPARGQSLESSLPETIGRHDSVRYREHRSDVIVALRPPYGVELQTAIDDLTEQCLIVIRSLESD